MADVRSMLRQERAARQQPARPQKQSAAPAAAPTSRKRKAADDPQDGRKRTRTEEEKGLPAGFLDQRSEQPGLSPSGVNAGGDTAQAGDAPAPILTEPPDTVPDPKYTKADEDDLDAFIRQMEEAPKPQHALPGYSGAVIEGAPMTAAELAAQEREDQIGQRGQREEELEAEKDDAARQLEDEFEDMDELEERVRKLREKREALRIAQAQAQAAAEDIVVADPEAMSIEEESESDDEDWDDWRFRSA
ncbi:hypothetical protein BCR34DRAFT_555459 [Clohesyomyces aquaticus]|uniref:Uncharacterized protein n=1 Tax=Clohesyomyces aquaticus TaxID=1231657 RepID=A0A1Y2A542_9PLEO|nr:hypothetical protein BCR34DRAFT_555459 [Clohesyomyces aquaticus]